MVSFRLAEATDVAYKLPSRYCRPMAFSRI
jgi:hypothetical protein